jgi:sterol 24-C-methyltransferase
MTPSPRLVPAREDTHELYPWASASPERLARSYYDATTWIYRWAWGRSFHFAPLRRSQARRAAIRDYEVELARELDLHPGMLCLDLGCGIGGPAATVAAATAAQVIGISSSLEQLRRSRRNRHWAPAMASVGADFEQLPFAGGVLHRAYAFESLCHAVDLEAALREVFRVLRPGALLALSEWCLTDKFDPHDEVHVALRQTIEASYGVVRLRHLSEWRDCLLRAGFRVIRNVDRAGDAAAVEDHEPWYRALQSRDHSFDSLGRRRSVRALAAIGLGIAEHCRLAPPGTAAALRQLRKGTAALIEAGRRAVFTPMRFFLAKKDVEPL